MRKLTWQIQAAPTGRYRSFEHRGWPTAYYKDQTIIHLACEDEYVPRNVRSGKHAEIIIRVADRSNPSEAKGTFTWRRLKQRAKTLTEAKDIAQKFFNEHPEVFGLEKEQQ